jgi:hypothetical protein
VTERGRREYAERLRQQSALADKRERGRPLEHGIAGNCDGHIAQPVVRPFDSSRWALADKHKHPHALSGIIRWLKESGERIATCADGSRFNGKGRDFTGGSLK